MKLQFLNDLLNLFYPLNCYHCGRSLVREETILCSFCIVKLPYTQFHLDENNEMVRSLWGRLNVDFGTAYLHYRKSGIVKELLHALKYRGRKEIGIFLGERFGNHIRKHSFIEKTDYLVPVPLHRSKLRSRGYNQSELIVEGMSRVTGIPVLDGLSRISNTETQTHKHRFSRWENVSGNFVLEDPQIFENKRVLLVDDVFTTGATMEACCTALKQAGSISVGIAAVAIASG